MKYREGMKVNVISGDGVTPLGIGTYTGRATVYSFHFPDGSITSLTNAEQMPDEKTITGMKVIGGVLCEMEDNPRFVLENGKVVYGCQVWWSLVKEDMGNGK